MQHPVFQVNSFGAGGDDLAGQALPDIDHPGLPQSGTEPVLLYQVIKCLSKSYGLIPSHNSLHSVSDLFLHYSFPAYAVEPEINPGIVKDTVDTLLLGVCDKDLSELTRAYKANDLFNPGLVKLVKDVVEQQCRSKPVHTADQSELGKLKRHNK